MRIPRRNSTEVPPSPPLEGLVFRYDGNWCGPNYSDGDYQPSRPGFAPPVNSLDVACKDHDIDCYHGVGLAAADLKFAFAAARTGTRKGIFAALAVGAQGLKRKLVGPDEYPNARQKRIKNGPKVEVSPFERSFSVIDMRKYARKRRGVRKAGPKRRYKRKQNKSKSKYRTRRRIRRPRRVSSHNKRNYVRFEKEYGEAKADTKAVYIGHGTSGGVILNTLFMTFIKQLFAGMGIHFTDFNEIAIRLNAESVYSISVFYQANFSDVDPNEFAYSIPVDATYATIADAVCSGWQTQWIAENANGSPIFNSLELVRVDTVDPVERLAKIDLMHCRVKLDMKSSIRIQNKTKTDGGAADTDLNNVNPLEGSVYYGKRNRNYFEWAYKYTEAEASIGPWCPRSVYGHFTDTAAGHVAAGSTLFNQPPVARSVGASRRRKFVLHPGQIIVDEIKFSKTIELNYLMRILFEPIHQLYTADAQNAMNMGVVRCYGFEKLAYDRSVSLATAPPTVGFEINTAYGTSLKTYIPKVNTRFVENAPAA